MLTISAIANSNYPLVLGNAFAVAALELLDETTLLVWFTRNTTGSVTPGNYTISGPSSVGVAFCQQQDDSTPDSPTSDATTRGARLYLDAPLTEGQWTLSISGITSQDSDALSLPANTQIVFDLMNVLNEDSLGSGGAPSVSDAIPKAVRNKRVYSAILAGIDAGDNLIREQARAGFDQLFICSSEGSYLNKNAADNGITKPDKLGIVDRLFKKLTIETTNSKLTSESFLSLLETIYGPDSVKAFVESQVAGPFQLFDGAYLDILIDGKTSLRWVADISKYPDPLHVSATAIVHDLNLFFDKSGGFGYAEVTDDDTIRLYSNTKGSVSSIAIAGGTAQPYLQLGEPIDTKINQEFGAYTWTITNPVPGTVRLELNADAFEFPFVKIRVGDYVTIIGENFPEGLRGSWPVTDVNFTVNNLATYTNVLWIEIESSYEVP